MGICVRRDGTPKHHRVHKIPPQKLFEGVSVTTVILAPGACGLGLRAALLATTSASAQAPVAVFQESPISCYLSYLRARGLSKIDPNLSISAKHVNFCEFCENDARFQKGGAIFANSPKKTHVSQGYNLLR